MVVETDKAVDHFVYFGKGSRFVTVDALCFAGREEIFRHGVVIASLHIAKV